VRIFLDMGDPLQALLQRVVGRAERYARKLLSMIEGADSKVDSPLSEREHEILQLLARGMSNQEIAEELFIAASTVKAHVTHVYQKLGVQKRLQAVALAREKGFLL
jgi:LuxR family maltose regulon positive regulatory protein